MEPFFKIVDSKRYTEIERDELNSSFNKILEADGLTGEISPEAELFVEHHASKLLERWELGRRGNELLTDS